MMFVYPHLVLVSQDEETVLHSFSVELLVAIDQWAERHALLKRHAIRFATQKSALRRDRLR
jgi:hypothetical protein